MSAWNEKLAESLVWAELVRFDLDSKEVVLRFKMESDVRRILALFVDEATPKRSTDK